MAGKALAQRAREAGITAPALADFLGACRGYVARVFAGKAEPSPSMVAAVEALAASRQN